MRRLSIPIVLWLAFMAGCAARTNKTVGTAGTLAELRNVRPDVQEVKVEQGLEQAMQNYRRFLEETPETTMTPEAMRRLADLQLVKQFGIRTGDAKPRQMAAPRVPGQPAERPFAAASRRPCVSRTASRVAGPRGAASPRESSWSPVSPRGSAGSSAWPARGPARPSPPARPGARYAAPPASPPSPPSCWYARRSRP